MNIYERTIHIHTYTNTHTHELRGISVNDFLSLYDIFLDLLPVDQPPQSPKLVEFPETFKLTLWDFPGGLVAETLSSQCKGPRFNFWSGN